jgi:nucleotide-binding universal stress UspA family protein
MDAGRDPRLRAGGDGDRDHQARLMFKSILVGTDGSETAHTALRRAIELAASLGARLEIVSAYEPVSDPRLRGEKVIVPKDVQ